MPFDRSKYPANWKEIRAAILERAGNCCERCGVANGLEGFRELDGTFVECRETESEFMADLYNGTTKGLKGYRAKSLTIVLTIAHVTDPNPMNCAPENLAAWCQRCHLLHDLPQHMAAAAATRARKKGQAVMDL